MSSMLQQAQQAASDQLKRLRWMLGLSGAASIALGIAIIVWPNISLYTFVILFGAYALVRGVFGLVAAIGSPIKQGRGWLIVSSLAGIAVGVLVFLRTDMSALALLYVIGAYALILGVIALGGAFWLPLNGTDKLLLALTGVVSIVFGIVMFAEPGAGALALLALIAAYALIVGLAELTVAIGGKRILRSVEQRYAPATPERSH